MTLHGDVVKRITEIGLRCDCGPDGDPNATVAIVAEAPGEREAKLKSPLVGASGQVLWKVLRHYDIKRTQLWVTNVIKRALTSLQDEEKISVPTVELQHWHALLQWELCQLPNLQIVVLLGNHALRAITGEDGINNWRGSVLQDVVIRHVDASGTVERTVTAICCNNPAAVLRTPQIEVVFNMDVGRLPMVMRGDWYRYEIKSHINPTPEEAIRFISVMRNSGKPIAFDIETMSKETACVGLANDPHEGMCINFRDMSDNRWSTRDELNVRIALQELFSDRGVEFVAHNGNFDSYWLWYKDRIRVHRVWFDTMLAHHWLYPSLPHGLGFLCTQYTTHPYYKDELHDWREGGDIDRFWRYNITDCCVTLQCMRYLAKELRNTNSYDQFMGHVMRLQPHLVRMTVGGVKINIDEKEAAAADLREQVELLRFDWQNRVKSLLRDPTREVNPDSNKQLGQLLFNDLGLVGYGRSVDRANRQRIKSHPRTPPECIEMLDLLDRYKEEAKFYSTYANMTIDPDGRFRCEYKQMGVQSAPGRLSSSQTMWDSGGNGQNMPERAKAMFEADADYTFLYFDMSQAEARVVAWVAEIQSWMDQFERARLDGSYDCHRALAADMFGVPYDEVPTADRDDSTGRPTIRFIAKRCRHGLNYRMGAGKLAEVTGLSVRDADTIYAIYHRTTPELRTWWKATEELVRTTRVLVSPYGRRLPFLGRIDEASLQSVVAFVPQSTVGDHVSRVIYAAEEDHRWPEDARVALNIHDALISLVPQRKVEVCAEVLKDHAERPIAIKGRKLVIPAEFAVGIPDNMGRVKWNALTKIKDLSKLSLLLPLARLEQRSVLITS